MENPDANRVEAIQSRCDLSARRRPWGRSDQPVLMDLMRIKGMVLAHVVDVDEHRALRDPPLPLAAGEDIDVMTGDPRHGDRFDAQTAFRRRRDERAADTREVFGLEVDHEIRHLVAAQPEAGRAHQPEQISREFGTRALIGAMTVD
jgi:hypothetical protein